MTLQSRLVTALLAAGLLLACPAVADEVQLPALALDPTGPVIALWRPDAPAAGELQLDWTEGEGRQVERHRIKLAEPALPLPGCGGRVEWHIHGQRGGRSVLVLLLLWRG